MQGSGVFPNVATQQPSQLPNLPIAVGAPSSLAVTSPEARFLSEQQQPASKKIPSFEKETLADLKHGLTGRPPVVLYMPCDDAVISRYVLITSCLVDK